MRGIALAGLVIVSVVACAEVTTTNTSPVADLADGRAGTITFESVTPSGFFALARRETKGTTAIVGTLRLPAKSTGRVPAMVIAHGSGGVSQGREFWWASELADVGIAAFVVDSFGPRSIRETATDQSQLSTAANVADALSALRLLATHPRIDTRRIGVMGFSKGGQVALYTALEPLRRAVIADDVRFAAHVPLYPYCNDWFVADRITAAPLLVLLGGRDDYTPPAPCHGYVDWFKSKGADASVVVYPNAYHGFDSSRMPVFAPNVMTGRTCERLVDLDRFTVTIRSTGMDITASADSYSRSCVGRGATVGGDGEARRRAPRDVKAFLAKTFGL